MRRFCTLPRALACAALTLLLTAGLAAGAHAAVTLNEINCEGTDWIELANTSDAAVDLSGWLLTDDPITGTRADHRLLIAAGTTIPAHGTRSFEKSAGGFPFGVSCGADTIRLADAGAVSQDEEAVPALPAGAATWGRLPDGTGTWQGTQATRDTANIAAGPGPEDQLAAVLDPGVVTSVDLHLPDASRAALALVPTEYQPGTFTLHTADHTYGPYDVGIRIKGNSTQRTLDQKAAFKVKFNFSVSGQRFLGLKSLTLNNMVQDPSMLHETLMYALARAVGVPAPRTGYSFVTVDGAPFGVYLSLETVDDVMLRRWLPTTSHLYEGAYGVDVRPDHIGTYEVDEGNPDDRSDLMALADAAQDPADWDTRIGALADLDEMTTMWAVERYGGQWDGYAANPFESAASPNNYFLHSDAAGRFAMLPWGTDGAWTMQLAPGGHGGVLFDGCLADAACEARYLRAIETVKTAVASLDLPALATATAALLRPAQERDPRREVTMEEIDQGTAEVLDFLAARRADPQWLAVDLHPEPVVPPPDPPVTTTTTTPTTTTPVTPPVVVVPTVKVTVPRVSTRSVSETVKVSAAGTIRQRSTVRKGSSTLRVCLIEEKVRSAQSRTVRCTMSSWARRYVNERGGRTVTVTTTFTPAHGQAVSTVVTVRPHR